MRTIPQGFEPRTPDEARAADEIVWEGGERHLVDDTATPADAHRADLLAVAAALEAEGVGVLLARHGIRGVALVIDARERDAAWNAICALADVAPFRAKPKGRKPMDPSEYAPHEVDSVRLYRPRTVSSRSLRYGAATGARVEFWRLGEDTVDAPSDNALLRRRSDAADLEPASVERFGRSWATWRGMFDADPAEVTEPIDMVFSWVDGSSSEFQRLRAARMSEYVVGEGDDGPARFRHVDELRYALRSVHMYAPWVRRIFIATDSPRPAWLADDPRVTIVRSEEFFADVSVLPTHNSHAVEAQLHRIEGLSEHFLYSNDDMFFARPVAPELFFTAGGISRFVECGVRIGPGAPRTDRSGHDNALRNNRALLQGRFGRTIVRDLEHCATPLRRSVAAELAREFAPAIDATAASRFRNAADVSVTNSLYHYYAAFTGRALATTEPRTRYFQTTEMSALARMERLVARRDVDMFCLNDGGEGTLPEHERVPAVTSMLERMFPVRAPWERTVEAQADADENVSAR